ncbi:MAG: uncharacterized protein QOH88_2355 [Verrucomicrobiota bacterium]|jgi:predicted TIM-barrel fold metal-dependent hydrolase
MIARILQLLSTLLTLTVTVSFAQTGLESELAAEIAQIKAIDHHAHPLRFVASGEPEDTEYDALTFEEMEPGPMPARFSPDNPEYIPIWRALYGYTHADHTEEHVRELIALKRKAMGTRSEEYPAWILDQIGIQTMFANRVAMGSGLMAPRFRWVAFDDALIFPLNNESLRRLNPDYRSFFVGEGRLLKRYLDDSGVEALPATLKEYLSKVVLATLERQKTAGAVAVKFEAAYLRSLDFADAPEKEAEGVYTRFAKGGDPSPAEYKILQDFLFRFIAREAGRLGLAVHIHCSPGAGSYYSLRTANPLLLEPLFNDPSLRKTNFVIIHGGWPFIKETAYLLHKPNVYADFSVQNLLLYPRALSETLRTWLEMIPEKILFGTDAMPLTPEVNWEETAMLATNTTRRALAMALSGMISDGEITRERASALARMVMRENALKLYGLPPK